MLSIGSVIDGRYEVLGPLAEGGMGAVYRARRVHLGDEVALKIIRVDAGHPALRERFLREARACAQLQHPNIVRVFDFNFDAAGQPFIVMELLSGPSLKEELEAGGRMDFARVRAIVRPLASALQVAHDAGIVHRDLKPANIVSHRYASGERVYKLVDFGLATVREPSQQTRLTAADQFVGTLAYASPEQLCGGPVDARTDVYSFAAVTYEALAGRLAGGGTMAAITTGHVLPAGSGIRGDVPAEIDGVLRKAMSPSREDRYASIAEFADAFCAGETPASATTTRAGLLLETYELGAQIAQGRFGSRIYSARHRAMQHPVAIRVLRRTDPLRWDAQRARFLHEARSMQALHPSVLNVRDYGEQPDLVYVVTDLLQGVSLRQAIDGGPFAWPRLRDRACELCDAATALGRRGVRITGLSPGIVRLASEDEAERLVISSPGILQLDDVLATASEGSLRGGGQLDPELPYVAPEVLTGAAPDARSDVFTIGCLTYEMATGAAPYTGSSLVLLIGAMLRGAPAGLRERRPDIPESAASGVMQALAAAPDKRPATPRDLSRALCVST